MLYGFNLYMSGALIMNAAISDPNLFRYAGQDVYTVD